MVSKRGPRKSANKGDMKAVMCARQQKAASVAEAATAALYSAPSELQSLPPPEQSPIVTRLLAHSVCKRRRTRSRPRDGVVLGEGRGGDPYTRARERSGGGTHTRSHAHTGTHTRSHAHTHMHVREAADTNTQDLAPANNQA